MEKDRVDIPFKWILPTESLPALEEEVVVLVDTSSYGRKKDIGYLFQIGDQYKWELDHYYGEVLAWWPIPPKEDNENSEEGSL